MKIVKSNMLLFAIVTYVVRKTNSLPKLYLCIKLTNLLTIIQLQNSLVVGLISVLNLIYVTLDLNKF